MRKLATIRCISGIESIPNADAIEIAVVDGWKVVVKKGEFSVGDLVIYIEIDSWVPHEIAPFLTKNEPKEYENIKGNRLRTVKLRGQVSQGLILPLHVLQNKIYVHEEGADVSEQLGIIKWEAPIPAELAGEIIGMFPSEIPKTDQERCQNLTKEIKEWEGKEFEITEKLDGSSCTFYLDVDGNFHVCSRNIDLKPSESNSFWKMAIKYDIENKMRAMGLFGIAIQGELIGEGIQGNPYKLHGQDFYVFDVYSEKEKRYYFGSERVNLAQELSVPHVPILTNDINHNGYEMNVEFLLNLAEGKSVLNPGTEREGLVFKCLTDPNIHFKAISNRFLLKSKE